MCGKHQSMISIVNCKKNFLEVQFQIVKRNTFFWQNNNIITEIP